ncbi:hypothetical protein KQX54_011214 [Cotesia glomerata]|uniref:Metalloendopeptidase n=1 Tax=Cotesia glomerata TaxID=32391 RepID=A0AAV7IUF6_COTGL|nr:hypothetical protein KQX54_011214 [Cotesia glomerata]
MLYSTNKFARDRSKNTITPLKTEDIEITKIGRYEQLSAIDINGANRLYNCSECRQLIESDSGVFNVVKDLNSSTSITKHCEWRMVGAPGERVIFHISSWSVPDTVGLDVCGEGGLEEVASEASQLLITYHTNTLNSKYFGFTGNFRKVCRGDIDIVDEEKEYYLEFPGFPYQYTANKYCVWYPNASPNRKIILKFDYFQLEASENCKNDYIEIRKGNYYYSPLIGKYCINTSLEEICISRSKRSLGVKEWYYLWPEGRIPYIIDTGSFDGSERRLIKQAMREWERSTCVRFMDRQNFRIHPDYVYFLKSDAECYTRGTDRRHAGRNHVYLGENCLTKRTILHELGHIIELHHEHQRPDRDEYVRVNMDNV